MREGAIQKARIVAKKRRSGAVTQSGNGPSRQVDPAQSLDVTLERKAFTPVVTM